MQNLSTSFSSFYSGSLLSILKNSFQFLVKVHRTGKTIELCSFIWWELLYKVGYYSTSKTVSFTGASAFTLDESGRLVSHVDAALSVQVERSPIDWKHCFQDKQGSWWGCEYGNDDTLIKANDGCTHEFVGQFPARIQSLHVTQKLIFICAGGILYRSSLDDYQFQKVLQLTTPQSYFLFNNGFTELPNGTLLLGEYASIWRDNTWVNLAHLYISSDRGCSWELANFLKKQGVNKHIHLVKFSALLNQVFLTDGDNKKQIWRNENLSSHKELAMNGKEGWQLINRFHWQMGGYTSMLEHGKGVVFGTDYLGGTNFLVHTNDGYNFQKQVIPGSYRRSPVINMVARRIGDQIELWALLHNSVTPGKSCLVMNSRDGGLSWERFIEYDGRKHEIQLISSSATTSGELYFCVRQYVNGRETSQTYRIR